MFASFARRPIAQQLIVATISAFVIVFAVLILVMQQKAESTAIKGTETNLEHEARLMAGMLDSTYEAVKIRGENESQFFRKYMGGQLEAGTGLVRTGDVDLPVVKLGNEVLNGQARLLKAFRELAGSDAALVAETIRSSPAWVNRSSARNTVTRLTATPSRASAASTFWRRIEASKRSWIRRPSRLTLSA